MGGKSKSETATETQANTTTTTTNNQDIKSTSLGLEDIEGGAIAGNSGPVSVTTISSDSGAIEAGRKLGESALDSNEKTAAAAFGYAGGVARESLNSIGEVSGKAIDRVTEANAHVLDFGEAALDKSFSFGTNIAGQAIGASKQSTEQGFKSLGGAITAAGEATRSDTADTLNKLAKYGAIAVTVIVGGGIIASVAFKKKAA